MAGSARILGLSSGPLDAKVVFIGEAPGRLGADATGIPFHGDKAGDNFESLLDIVGISREDIFVTNAVLCNPKDHKGNNASPTTSEISNCSVFLREQIDLVNPAIVVTLGANALRAAALIEDHGLSLRENVRSANRWYGRKLIPLYHPGQRAMIHRSLANQRSDYRFVADLLKKVGVKPRIVRGTTNSIVADVVKLVLREGREFSYFSLHKILYLLEWSYMQDCGKRLTGGYFIRQKDGPYCTDLHLTKLKAAIPGLRVRNSSKSLHISLPGRDMFDEYASSVSRDIEEYVDEKLRELGGKTESQLKTRAYLTKPMKQILRYEKKSATGLYNTPILLGW